MCMLTATDRDMKIRKLEKVFTHSWKRVTRRDPLVAVAVMAATVGTVVFNDSARVFADDEVRVASVQSASSSLDPAVESAQQQRVAAMKRAAEATVAIFGLDGGGGGSGVLITPDGYALTNYHVSSACGDHMRCGLNDGRVYDAVIVGVDATGDVSLIKLLGREDFPIAALADSDSVRVWPVGVCSRQSIRLGEQPSAHVNTWNRQWREPLSVSRRNIA